MVVMFSKPVQWIASKEWQGETAYIVGGGTSVKEQNLGLLCGRRVIAINSSYLTLPFAQFLFFGDARWYNEQRRKHAADLDQFAGRIVTCSDAVRGPKLLKLTRINPPPGFTPLPTHVASQRTSLQGAMNMTVHLGVRRIVIIGADMGRAADGSTHYHEPHPWPNAPGNSCWDQQMEQLILIAEPLRQLGIEVLNVSPISRIGWWPKVSLEHAIEKDLNNGK